MNFAGLQYFYKDKVHSDSSSSELNSGVVKDGKEPGKKPAIFTVKQYCFAVLTGVGRK